MTTVKVYLDGSEIRRFVMGDVKDFKAFKATIGQLFPSLAGKDFTLSWRDVDGDPIVMSSDVELSQATLNMEDGLLRVYATIVQPGAPGASGASGAPGASGAQAPADKIHAGVLCDVCDTEIHGVRYKCLQCEDYDMCDPCHLKRTHEEHDMLKLVNPGVRPIWGFPGWKRLWRHCAKSTMGGGRGHHGWGHRRGGPPGPHRGCPAFRGCPATQAAGPSAEGGATAQDPTHAARVQYHELLNGIGDTIANLLDPLGINVAYHVERASETAPTPDDHSKKDSATEPMDTTQDGAGGRPKTSEAAAQSTEAAKTPDAPRSSEPQAAATGGVFCPFGSIPQNLGSVPKPTPAPESEPMTEPDVSHGWTLLNALRESIMVDDSNAAASAPAASPAQQQCNGSKIDTALSQMLVMGFDNEGGWLRQLLEVKRGDISAVLESLHPSPK
ncbi:sequestosome-1 [Ixodes scapularis]|uniref:sequestosome-1 n=1 Tax=Ixodes scapularis TaxID=6945 RepID=UPI001A9F04E3|nr:sequestosome-1 [Ixodes scapularis]